MIDIRMAFQRMHRSLEFVEESIRDVVTYYDYVSYRGFFNKLCRSTCNAAELLVKSTAHLRGFNPVQTHDLRALCNELEKRDAKDSLLSALRELDGVSHRGHVGGTYLDDEMQIEDAQKSKRRLVLTLQAFRDVLDEAARICAGRPQRLRYMAKGARNLQTVIQGRYFRVGLQWLREGSCPPRYATAVCDAVHNIEVGLSRALAETRLAERQTGRSN